MQHTAISYSHIENPVRCGSLVAAHFVQRLVFKSRREQTWRWRRLHHEPQASTCHGLACQQCLSSYAQCWKRETEICPVD